MKPACFFTFFSQNLFYEVAWFFTTFSQYLFYQTCFLHFFRKKNFEPFFHTTLFMPFIAFFTTFLFCFLTFFLNNKFVLKLVYFELSW